ncbi:MAG TPA: hypothetical protein VLL54_00750 [Pyrinomonadaceae bacterium]|nr:hypothetical protein [Pyrinomonadaceae bacterium]
MADEGTLGLARGKEREENGEAKSKEVLQRRMELARDSITNTVSEIKENVTQQYESVKDALDWREHFKRAPVAWSVGAAGVGFLVGYGVAAALTDNERAELHYASATSRRPLVSQQVYEAPAASQTNGKDHPGMLERFKETSAYDRLSKEAGSLGDRFIEELSTTAHEVVLPALLTKIKGWIGLDLSAKPSATSRNAEGRVGSYEPVVGGVDL